MGQTRKGDTLGIGEFALLTGISIPALRHYHEVGLLVPCDVDRWTGYRRYRLVRVASAFADPAGNRVTVYRA